MRFRVVLSRHGAALLAAALPCLVWLAPILRDPAHTVIGREGDNLFYVRQFWWMKRALLDLHQLPFFDATSYVPIGYSMSRGELTPANTLLGLPITAVAGPIAAYNLMVIAGFLLTGWATYAWVYRLSGSRGGALVAAIIAELAPYRLAHAAGHLPLITTQWFPLALWALEEVLRSPLPSRRAYRWAIALGASLAMAALSSWYYAYSLSLMFPLYAVLRTRLRREIWRSGAWWRSLALAGTVSAVLVAPFIVPYLRASLAGGLQRSFVETDSWSLNVYDFVIPNLAHPLWGAAARFAFPQEASQWVERAVCVGYVALGLALVTVLGRRRAGAPVLALTAVALVSALVALGPLLHSGDRQVLLPMPYLVTKTVDWLFFRVRPESPFRTLFWTQQVTPVPLPAVFLFLFVPGTGGMRSFGRFGYWTVLMIAALAGLAVRELLAGARGLTRRAAAVVVAIVVAAVVFESWSRPFTSRWEPRPVDEWVARQPPHDVVVELPLPDALRAAQDYYTTIQQHPSVLGWRGDSFQPPVLRARKAALSALPSAAGFDALRTWGATILIVQTTAITDWPSWQAALSRAGATEAAQFGETRVYRLAR